MSRCELPVYEHSHTLLPHRVTHADVSAPQTPQAQSFPPPCLRFSCQSACTPDAHQRCSSRFCRTGAGSKRGSRFDQVTGPVVFPKEAANNLRKKDQEGALWPLGITLGSWAAHCALFCAFGAKCSPIPTPVCWQCRYNNNPHGPAPCTLPCITHAFHRHPPATRSSQQRGPQPRRLTCLNHPQRPAPPPRCGPPTHHVGLQRQEYILVIFSQQHAADPRLLSRRAGAYAVLQQRTRRLARQVAAYAGQFSMQGSALNGDCRQLSFECLPCAQDACLLGGAA